MDRFMFAFGLTLFAGLSTGIGSLISLIPSKNNKRFLSVSLGFSAGVMIYVAMIEIFQKAKNSLSGLYGEVAGGWITVGAFFAGIALIALIDKLIPSAENPHEMNNKNIVKGGTKLMRMGLLTAIAIAVHNFPEGMATFISAWQDPSIGVPIAIAIAIHNIPEGIAVAVPIYYATGNRKRAFAYSFLSGLSEPIGGLLGYLVLSQFASDAIFGIVFAAVAGIMVFISFDNLLPTAREYGEHHLSIYGLLGGMAVMAVSLMLFI
ncbi:zinc transporter ZupT [Clostridia bacterium OttesenSCG-928-F22]|nr:zinc transporter ZupT [Clostridia bacterium OttesenSCG-928-F22]